MVEKALPSGSRKANMAGTPGQRRMSSVSTPAVWSLACAASAFSVVNRMPMAPRVTLGRRGFEGDDHGVVAGGEFDAAAAVGRRGVAQRGEAERVDVEAQRGVLVVNVNVDGADAGDEGVGGAHRVLRRGLGGMRSSRWTVASRVTPAAGGGGVP